MKNFAIACAGFALLLASPVFADDPSDAAVEATALKAIMAAPNNTNAGIAKALPNRGLAATPTPAAGVPPMIGNFILVGAEELSAGLPCFFCAPAPGGGFGVALTIPVGYIPTSLTTLDYSYMFQDVSVTGNCSLGFALMQGTTVLDTSKFGAGIYPATWVVTFPRNRPSASGAAAAFGVVVCNGGGLQVVVRSKVFLQ
jgi:hypothetical protein